MKNQTSNCAICQNSFPQSTLFPLALLHPEIRYQLEKGHPHLQDSDLLCQTELYSFYGAHKKKHLQTHIQDKPPLPPLFLENVENNNFISNNFYNSRREKLTTGERLADRVAQFGGSWLFIIILIASFFLWVALNTYVFVINPFDPYPYILLNLVIGFIATFQAPIILMSQNRQETRDRDRAEQDYMINLKAEIEIRQINEKIDHTSKMLWEKLSEIEKKVTATI